MSAAWRFDALMTPSPSPTLLLERRSWLGVPWNIPMLVLIYFAVPFVGVGVSVGIPLATHLDRHRLWPETSRTSSSAWSFLAWVGLLWPGVLSVFNVLPGGMQVATMWLLIPLCGPNSILAFVLPTLAAVVVSFVGLLGSVAMRRPWAWVAALWLAPWVYHLVMSLLGPVWAC
jgi:hypothetical protein